MKYNKNIKLVKIREDRKCEYCGKQIKKQEKAITINRYMKGRIWMHEKCYENFLKIKKLKTETKSLPFDDDGSYYAFEDYIIDLLIETNCCYDEMWK